MKMLLRIINNSLLVILITSLAAIVYSLLREGGINLTILFNTNFAAGALLICTALTVMAIPARLLALDKLSDHRTFAERHMEQREQKRKKAYTYLFIGITVILIAGLIQLAITLLK